MVLSRSSFSSLDVSMGLSGGPSMERGATNPSAFVFVGRHDDAQKVVEELPYCHRCRIMKVGVGQNDDGRVKMLRLMLDGRWDGRCC